MSAHAMRGALVAMRVLLCSVLIGCVSIAHDMPALNGDGILRAVDIPGGRGTLASVCTPAFVVFATTGPAPVLVCADRQLTPVTQTKGYRLVAPAKEKDNVLCCGALDFTVLSCPEFRSLGVLDVATEEDRRKLGGFVGSFCLLRYRTGWVHVNKKGEVACVESEPLRIGRSGRARMEWVQAAAVDEKTGTLVLCSAEGNAELFDVEKMESRRLVELGCGETGGHVSAGDGTAWISTVKGVFVQLDLGSGEVTGRIALGEQNVRNSVTLDLSTSGHYLAACASRFVKGGDQPTELRVFRVERGVLTEMAKAQADLPHVLNSITILEDEHVVVLNSQDPVFAWHFGKEGGAKR